jgi:hypothetical protein
MKEYRLKLEHQLNFSSDVEKIVEKLASQGIRVSYPDAYEAWELYSDSMAASWMWVPDDPANLICSIMPYLEEVE